MWQSNQVPCSTGAFWKTWLDESANEANSQLLWPKRLNENSNNDRHQKKKKKTVDKNWEKNADTHHIPNNNKSN